MSWFFAMLWKMMGAFHTFVNDYKYKLDIILFDLSINLVIHSAAHLFTINPLTPIIQNPFIHSFHHPFIHPSNHTSIIIIYLSNYLSFYDTTMT